MRLRRLSLVSIALVAACSSNSDGPDLEAQVDESVLESEEHLAVAREAAAEGAVLLKNTGGALPLSPTGLSRIAVVGVLADEANTGDTGSSSVRSSFVVTPLQGIQEALGDSVAIDHIDKNVLDAADLATIGAADAVIIVTGLTSEDEGEGLIGAGDRVDLGLGAGRTELIQDAAGAPLDAYRRPLKPFALLPHRDVPPDGPGVVSHRNTPKAGSPALLHPPPTRQFNIGELPDASVWF
jgi:hypothetical protein